MANHDDLYNGVEPVFDGRFIRLSFSKDIVCPGTFVFFSQCDVVGAGVGQAVGRIIRANHPTASEVHVNVFRPPCPDENIAPLQQSYIQGTIEVSLIVCVRALPPHMPKQPCIKIYRVRMICPSHHTL